MPKYTSGINLLKNQFVVLFQKKIIYTYRRWLMTLIFVRFSYNLRYIYIYLHLYVIKITNTIFLQGFGSILLGILTIKVTNGLFDSASIPRGLNLSLSTYEDSSVFYRAGDHNIKNLEPNFVAISKKNQATVKEGSKYNNIINGNKLILE